MGPGSGLSLDTELHEAVRFSDICEVEAALNKKNDPNQIGLYQWAPVHEAACNGDVDILQLLLKHGGNANVEDELKRRTPLHYATEEGHVDCVVLLIKAGADCFKEDSDGQSACQLATRECSNVLNNLADEKLSVRSSAAKSSKDSVVTQPINEDALSVCSNSSSIHSAFQSVNHQSPTLGHIELSFEYDSRKKTLRIRVWQVSDILLPPENVSMISTIYVKSFLIPDSSRASKRKTEEIKVIRPESQQPEETSNNILGMTQSVNFKFSKPLDYTGINKEDVENKTVQIELCVTQKYSRKTYLVSMYRLPCKTAVRKLVRQKYPLIACNKLTTPESMSLCGAVYLGVPVSYNVYHSNPNLQSSSRTSLNSGTSGYAASDTALEQISVEANTFAGQQASHSNVVITISAVDSNNGEDTDLLSEVKSIPSKTRDGQSTKDTSISLEDCNNDPFCLTEVSCVQSRNNDAASVSESIKFEMTKKMMKRLTTCNSGKYPVSLEDSRKCLTRSQEASPVNLLKISPIIHKDSKTSDTVCGSGTSSPSHSRPDTPSWDHSDILSGDVGISMEPFEQTELSEHPTLRSGSCLPLPSSLSIPCRETSFSTKSSPNTVIKRDESQSSRIKKGKRPMKKSGFQKESNIHYKSSNGNRNGDLQESQRISPRDITLSNLTPCELENGCPDEADSVCIDIDCEDDQLPESILRFSVPRQVFLSDDED